MNKLAIVFLSVVLSSCVTYKIVPGGNFSAEARTIESITVAKINKWPEGNHCFEPMMYVLTLGIIPTHCVDTYSVSSDSRDFGKVKVTFVQGWVALFMAPLPTWQYGYGSEVESEIKDIVQVKE